MNLYSCNGHRSVRAESLHAAGEKFARIKAHRLGTRGRVGACRVDSWARDGSAATFQAYIGRYNKQECTLAGKNEWYVVRVAERVDS